MRGLPRWVLVPAILGTLFIVVPVIAMILRVDVAPGPDGTGGFWALITSPTAIDALSLSLRTGLAATALCIVLGAPMALVLARTNFPGQRLVRALVLLPLVLPPVVGGIALLYTFGRRGLIGQHLEVFGIEIAFTTAAVIMAQTFVALPFLVLSLEGTLRTNDSRFEEVAATLGASPSTVLRRVTLPASCPGCCRAPCWHSPAHSGNSARPSHSPGRCRASPRPCHWRSTWSAAPTRTPRSRCRWSWSSWP